MRSIFNIYESILDDEISKLNSADNEADYVNLRLKFKQLFLDELRSMMNTHKHDITDIEIKDIDGDHGYVVNLTFGFKIMATLTNDEDPELVEIINRISNKLRKSGIDKKAIKRDYLISKHIYVLAKYFNLEGLDNQQIKDKRSSFLIYSNAKVTKSSPKLMVRALTMILDNQLIPKEEIEEVLLK